MNIKTLVSLVAAAGFCASAAAADNTVLVTQGKGMAGLDVQTTGEVTALQFAIDLPPGAKGINTDNCLSGLPSTHVGKCGANDKGRVAVVIYSPGNEPLPAGMAELGKITFQSAGKGAIALDKIVFAGAKGSLPAQGRVESLDAPRPVRGAERVK